MCSKKSFHEGPLKTSKCRQEIFKNMDHLCWSQNVLDHSGWKKQNMLDHFCWTKSKHVGPIFAGKNAKNNFILEFLSKSNARLVEVDPARPQAPDIQGRCKLFICKRTPGWMAAKTVLFFGDSEFWNMNFLGLRILEHGILGTQNFGTWNVGDSEFWNMENLETFGRQTFW